MTPSIPTNVPKVLREYRMFALFGRSMLDLPEGAQILNVRLQTKGLVLSALVDPSQPTERRAFDAYRAGDPVPADPGDYVATFQRQGGRAWHLFEAAQSMAAA